jgi:hypothetical protein
MRRSFRAANQFLVLGGLPVERRAEDRAVAVGQGESGRDHDVIWREAGDAGLAEAEQRRVDAVAEDVQPAIL